jgi:hypothetical protein
MCMIDGCDERVEVLQSADRKARKEHRCGECHRAIAMGETYHYEFGILMGETETYRTCAHCMVAREWLRQNYGGWVYEMTIEEMVEHAREYPKLAMPLYRVAAGARRHWRSSSGTLMALPKMPPAITVHE